MKVLLLGLLFLSSAASFGGMGQHEGAKCTNIDDSLVRTSDSSGSTTSPDAAGSQVGAQ
jgi:hypothetical protein